MLGRKPREKSDGVLRATYPNATTIVWWAVAPIRDQHVAGDEFFAVRWFKLGAFDRLTREPKEWPIGHDPPERTQFDSDTTLGPRR